MRLTFQLAVYMSAKLRSMGERAPTCLATCTCRRSAAPAPSSHALLKWYDENGSTSKSHATLRSAWGEQHPQLPSQLRTQRWVRHAPLPTRRWRGNGVHRTTAKDGTCVGGGGARRKVDWRGCGQALSLPSSLSLSLSLSHGGSQPVAARAVRHAAPRVRRHAGCVLPTSLSSSSSSHR